MTSTEITEASDEQSAPEEKKKIRKLSLLKTREEMTAGDYARNYVLETLAVFLWLYTLTKVFVFDVDRWLVGSFFPSYEWTLDFKLIFILALVCIIWWWVKTRDAIIWFLYITFYPLVLLFIRLPYFVFKQQSWLLAFAIFNAIASFFSNLRYGLVFSTIFLAAFAVAIFSDVNYLLTAAATVLVTLVLAAYIKAFLGALKPTVIFQIYTKFFKGVRKVGHVSFAIDAEIRDLPVEQMEPKQLEKWNTSLQTSVLFNRVCLFTAKKLRDYQISEWRVIPSIFGLLWLIVFTVVSFSGVYYALFKIDSALFRVTEEPSLFSFLYFSFNNLVLNATTEVAPAVMLSQSVYMIQASLSFLLVAILVTLFISYRAQRASSELDEVIKGVEEEGQQMETFIQEEYNIPSIDAAIERLKEMQTGLVQFLLWMSKGL